MPPRREIKASGGAAPAAWRGEDGGDLGWQATWASEGGNAVRVACQIRSCYRSRNICFVRWLIVSFR